MKKQFLIAGAITICGVCFCLSNENSLKACETGVAGYSLIIEKPVLDNSIRERIENHIPSGYSADAGFDMLLNAMTNL